MPAVVSLSEYRSRLRAALAWLEDDLGRPYDAAQCARLSCMAPFHFQAVFRRIVGCAPLEYLRLRRLSGAAGELLTTAASVETIAHRYGYQSGEAFSRAFRSNYHIWPGHYRDLSLDLFRLMSELDPGSEPSNESSATLYSIEWKKPRVFYGLFLQGVKDHAANMRLLYGFMELVGIRHGDEQWTIADRNGSSLGAYELFVGREASSFARIPLDLQVLELPERFEAEVHLHGSLDDLHGPFRWKALDGVLSSRGVKCDDHSWKLETPDAGVNRVRRGYRLSVPLSVSQ